MARRRDSAKFQIARIARERPLTEDAIRRLVARHTLAGQFGFLGEPRVNVVEPSLGLNTIAPIVTEN